MCALVGVLEDLTGRPEMDRVRIAMTMLGNGLLQYHYEYALSVKEASIVGGATLRRISRRDSRRAEPPCERLCFKLDGQHVPRVCDRKFILESEVLAEGRSWTPLSVVAITRCPLLI